MASGDSVAGLLSEVWKCLGLLRFPSVSVSCRGLSLDFGWCYGLESLVS